MLKLNSLKEECNFCLSLDETLNELAQLYDLASQNDEKSLYFEIIERLEKISPELNKLEIKTTLNNACDKNNAIVSIHSGAGGTESCDWVAMLARMYARWAEKQNYEIETIYSADGDEAGLKNITMMIRGKNKDIPSYAYGLLTSEIGVHRLVRISPFDSNKRRHTTFAAVDVIPEIDDHIEIKIEDKDIRIDTYRASGAGGQHVNTTDSAVRITHIPTNIIAQSQNERSQMQNKAMAMKLLKSRLYELEREKQRKSYEKHYNERGSIEWGSQIRSYVFMPYRLVKDHRTNHETSQVENVMNGDIDAFISAFLNREKLNEKEN
jgi:peptide chain release factor 2